MYVQYTALYKCFHLTSRIAHIGDLTRSRSDPIHFASLQLIIDDARFGRELARFPLRTRPATDVIIATQFRRGMLRVALLLRRVN